MDYYILLFLEQPIETQAIICICTTFLIFRILGSSDNWMKEWTKRGE
jgi:hypothetical protein